MSLQRRGGRVPGAEGYHKDDTSALLASVARVVPTTPDEWEQVLQDYRDTHATPNARAQRDQNSLKCKFKQLAKSNKPEGREASAIMEQIDAKLANGKWMQRRGGRARGAEGFSVQDAQAILACVRRVLPVYREDWDLTAEEYFNTYAGINDRVRRDGLSLKNKFRQWLKSDLETDAVSRPEVKEAKEIQQEILMKISRTGKDVESVDEAQDNDESNASESKSIAEEEEGHTEVMEVKHRRGGRPPGSEGYTRSDTKALLACVKQVLPGGPNGWDRVLQLYRVTHATPNNRSARAVSGIKSKFRQLVNYKEAVGQELPLEVCDARAIQREIDLSVKLGRNSEHGSAAVFVHTATAVTDASAHTSAPVVAADDYEHQAELLRTEHQNNENVERQSVVADLATAWTDGGDPLGKRKKTDPEAGVDNPEDDIKPSEVISDALRSEIANRELELLRQREQREAELDLWEKERIQREKHRMDMEAWTNVCDRLRTLYREQSSEQNPEIAGDIDEEIQFLKNKKQRLADML